MRMEIKIAIAKIDKPGKGTSGDTVEVTERPNGGISIVLADGQIEKRDSKAISTMVAHRVIEQISEGVRDGASIRAAAQSIFSEHQDKVQANLSVVSVDLQTNTIIVSRNNPMPAFLIREETVDCLSSESEQIGSRADVTPTIIELPIRPELAVVVFSDGVFHAGQDNQQVMDICTTIEAFIEEQEPTAKEIADFLLNRAIRLDDDQPKDDMSIIVLLVSSRPTDAIRRMNIAMPLD
jgi:serine phosphatase RsbU (regulator of sigma subunit)